jgi:hypothetical protein
MKSLKVILILLMTVITACGSSASTDTDTTSTEGAIIDATSATQPDPVPVSFNDGLASLNSYRLAITFKSTGPDPAQSSATVIESQRSSETDASVTNIAVTVFSPDGESSETSDTTTYDIGNSQCTGSDFEGWEWSDISPAEAEMQGLVARMIGMTPVIDDPSFVAAETVNGVPTNHFSFQVNGLGASSGSVVNINQGDYWLAVDGQYIVKYLLILEMSVSPTELLHEEISIEMNDINQPVSIAFPQGCLDIAPPPTATP